MATAQDLLNNVLRGLRRDIISTTSTTNSYHLLLLLYLNLAKDRIEEQWDWHALRTTVTLTLSAATTSYSLTGSGASDVAVSDKSRLLYERPARFSEESGGSSMETTDRIAGSVPQVFDVTDAAEYRLDEISPEQMERLHFTDNNETNLPAYFSLSRSGGVMTVRIWPTPSATRTLKLRFVIPQAVIPSTGMTAYTLSIPDRPVWLAALMKATEERGEEAGRSLQTIERDYNDALYMALDRERLDSDDTGYPI
jgi:hypothetical protein